MPATTPPRPPRTILRLCSPLVAIAQRNSTASDPSRITATIVMTSNAASGRWPDWTSKPTAFTSAESCLPCALIHTLCQVSMATAPSRITALRMACPLPEKAEEATLAMIATMDAPSSPRPIPAATHRAATGDPAACAEHDGNDECCFQHFPKHDYGGCEHVSSPCSLRASPQSCPAYRD